MIVGDSPSAVVHVTGPCGGGTFHRKTHHGRPAPTAVVALFMITFIPEVYYLSALVSSKLIEHVHDAAYFMHAYIKVEP